MIEDFSADDLVDRSIIFSQEGRHDIARMLALRAIGAEPRNARAHMALAELLLLHGEWHAGWIEYEWRTALDSVHLPPDKPVWTGYNLGDGDLIVVADQGFGDNIMFSRYLPFAARFCRHLYLGVDPAMAPLMHAAYPFLRGVFSSWQDHPPFSAYCRLSSLPYAMGFPDGPPLGEMRRLTRRLEPVSVRIGICDHGRVDVAERAARSVPYDRLKEAVESSGHSVIDLAFDRMRPQPRDWLETAHVVRDLTLVITTDTAVAHLAASLSVETWLLAKRHADWRWGLGWRSAWYPTMRIFRQEQADDWQGVLGRVASSLRYTTRWRLWG
jgi:hypothetical protein